MITSTKNGQRVDFSQQKNGFSNLSPYLFCNLWLGATGRHSPDHARALAEADVLRRLNGGSQGENPMLQAIFRGNDEKPWDV